MNRGYIKLWRKCLDSAIFQNEGLLKVWIWCLVKASHQGKKWDSVKIGRGITEIELLPGQFIFGRNTAAKELKMPPSTVLKRILKLKNLGNCDIKGDSNYSIITIVNWDTYQANENEKEQPKEQARNRLGTSKEHIQECKEGKECKENILEEKTLAKRNGGKFIIPTLEEVKAYCLERKNNIDPEYFIDSNTAKGWVVGKNKTPMKDWQATIRTWEKTNKKQEKKESVWR